MSSLLGIGGICPVTPIFATIMGAPNEGDGERTSAKGAQVEGLVTVVLIAADVATGIVRGAEGETSSRRAATRPGTMRRAGFMQRVLGSRAARRRGWVRPEIVAPRVLR